MAVVRCNICGKTVPAAQAKQTKKNVFVCRMCYEEWLC